MAIRVVCQSCDKVHRVSDEIAGRRARCDCGATFRVPRLTPKSSMPVGQRRRLLTEATLNEVLEELRRRGYHGVFSQIDLHEFGVESLADLVDAGETLTRGVETHLTEPLDEDRREALLLALADGLERVADPAAAEQADSYYEPFSLKGDELGLPLAEFKQRHHRAIPGLPHPAPFCSDRSGGGFAIAELHTQPWHAGAGVVHARLDYPSENHSPLVAGVATDLVLYQFLDGSLFQIAVFFGTEHFPTMAAALRNKHGAPTDEAAGGARLVWRRLHSTLAVAKGRLSPREPASLRLSLDEPLEEYELRRRQHSEAI